nr:alpha/beta fold hydrolase [Sphingobium sp. OAS761]
MHGSGIGVSGWANFGANLSFFSTHFRTIILDAPGYGQSAPVAGDPVQVAVDACVALLDGLDIDKAHVIGNSYGGIVGGNFAAKHPDRVDHYVTIGGIGYNLTSAFPSEGLTRLVDFVEEPTRERLIAWLHSMVYDKSIITDELVDARMKQALDPVTMESSKKIYTRAALGFIASAISGPEGAQRLDYLARIQAPTLITWGRDDKVNPLDGALLPMRMIPDATLHVFPRCGHWAMIERKAEFETLVLGFLTGQAG